MKCKGQTWTESGPHHVLCKLRILITSTWTKKQSSWTPISNLNIELKFVLTCSPTLSNLHSWCLMKAGTSKVKADFEFCQFLSSWAHQLLFLQCNYHLILVIFYLKQQTLDYKEITYKVVLLCICKIICIPCSCF